ncbi:MAG TPA: hypothetical protein VHR45_18405 [Thermoanaerobaculia bacterium]|nr:hypothetical protein [Thermoanaerobaculia bacterium]
MSHSAAVRQNLIGAIRGKARSLRSHASADPAPERQLPAEEPAPAPTPEPRSELSEGDIDPYTNKRIVTFIIEDNGFRVYLDKEHVVHCSPVKKRAAYPKSSGGVFNTVTYLETLSIPLKKTSHRLPMGRLLGEAVARMISDKRAAAARFMLEKAEYYLNARKSELARMWYLSAAGAVAALLALLAVGLWMARHRPVASLAAGSTALDVALTACCGGIGAFMFILGRSNMIGMEAGAGRKIHYVEGLARVVAGVAGGFTVALAAKADLLLGVTTKLPQAHGLALMLMLGLAAGASERLVPNLVGQVQARVGMKAGASQAETTPDQSDRAKKKLGKKKAVAAD